MHISIAWAGGFPRVKRKLKVFMSHGLDNRMCSNCSNSTYCIMFCGVAAHNVTLCLWLFHSLHSLHNNTASICTLLMMGSCLLILQNQIFMWCIVGTDMVDQWTTAWVLLLRLPPHNQRPTRQEVWLLKQDSTWFHPLLFLVCCAVLNVQWKFMVLVSVLPEWWLKI